MSATNQRNIFIDTEQYHGSDNKVQLLFPSQTLVVPQGFGMKLSLQQFTMKKSFYSINKYNNTFYVYNTGASGYYEVKIAEGNYYTFGDTDAVPNSLCKAIKTGFFNVGFTVDCKYDKVTGKLQIIDTDNFLTAAPASEIIFFQVPLSRQSVIPTNVTPNGYFSDTAEIFGGKAIQQDVAGVVPQAGMLRVGNTYNSFYPASLYSMENLRLLVNLGSSNLETPNMDANSSTAVCVTSQTFATIPLQTGTFDGMNLIEPAMITYTDGGDEIFSLKLQQNHIDNCNFSLVDGKGRPFDEVGDDQFKNGQMNYQMVIRYEIIEEPYVANPSNMPSGNRSGNLFPRLN